MKNLSMPCDSAVMFIRCSSDIHSISRVPEIFSQKKLPQDDLDIKLDCIKSALNTNMDLNKISEFYSKAQKINSDEFFKSESKTIIFTIDFQIENMINLQYILVLDTFLKQHNCAYYIILNTDSSSNTYYKLYNYFYGKYMPVYENLFIRTQDQVLKSLPKHDVSNYNAGEILPYFNIDYDFYKTFFKSFALNDNIIDSCDIKVKSREVDEKIMKSFTCVTSVELFAYRYIYSMLIKEKESLKTKTIIGFLEEHQDSPLFSIVIFIAIIYKSNMFRNGLDVWKNYLKRTYENCLNYTLSIEQLIENSLFYAGNGILSIRIHRKDSDAMKTICCKEKMEAKDIYMIEISLIDFQENIKDKSIKSCFIKNACVTELERESLEFELNKSDDLSDLFFYNNSNKVLNSYLNKPEVILQHYGLQTIGLLAKKTKSFFHMKSGKNYVPNSTGDMFLVQDKEQYPYNSGTLYRIIIPVTNKNEVQDSYSGIHSNKYETEEIDIKSIDILSSNVDDIIPKNREEKVLIVNKYRQLLLNEYESNKILSINVQKIDSRLYLECIVKASLDLLYSSSNKYIAIVGLRSKTFLKIALRFIVLSYTKLEKNNVFKDNEIFLCTDDCKTQILISGENLSDIIENLSSQRIFGAIDDDIFKEVSLTLETITGRS